MNNNPQQPGIVFTPETLQQLISGILEQSRAQNLEMIKELKKLPAHEQEELDDKLARKQQRKVNKITLAVEEERLTREKQFRCAHLKAVDGITEKPHAFRGQVNNDGCCRAQCIRCFKVFPPFRASQENLKSGMSLGNITTLTAEALWNAHMQSFPDCKECAKGNCAVRDLREFRNKKMDDKPIVLPDGKILASQIA